MRAGFAALFLLAALAAAPAAAHRLRLFATVADGAVTGFAFFTGGIRPAGLRLIVSDGDGTVLFEGATSADGSFRWEPPAPADLLVQVDAQDGHVAQVAIAAAQFGGDVPAPPAPPSAPPSAAPVATADDSAVAAAVRREIAPLLARIEEMDARLRLADLLSGIFLILGAAGGILWLRRR